MAVSSRSTFIGAVATGAVLVVRAAFRRSRRFDFTGTTVLVTGGSRGLGLLLAREFATAGANLVIAARDADELGRAEADLTARGAQVLAVAGDVGDEAVAKRLTTMATDRFGQIDVLVNNAGIIQVGPLETMTIADFEDALRTHFWGPLYLTLAVLPAMRRRQAGRIVNISSIGGKLGVPHLLPYCASKFALTGLSEGLRAELARDGISVTTVIPGLMRTGSPRNAIFKGQHGAEYAWFSLSDALPFTAMGAERAARQILDACQHGDAEVTLSWQARVAATLHALFPGPTAAALGVVNRFLPRAGDVGERGVMGYDSESPLTRSWVTALSRRAALRNNEIRQ